MNNPTEAKPTTGVCPACNYNLQGVIPNEDGRITCPECGISLHPRELDTVLTTKDIHKRFLLKLTTPTAVPAVGCLFFSHFAMINLLLGLLLVPFTILWSIALWITVSSNLIIKTKLHPRPMPRWLIPLLGLLYIFPALLLTYLYLFIASKFTISV